MDTVGELERLKALFQSGALSEQEFADAKAKIIGADEKVHAPSLGQTSGFAIASLVLGLLVLPSPLGLIFGLIALSQIKKSQGDLKGRGIAIAGVTISAVFSLGLVIVIILTGGIGLGLSQFDKASRKTVYRPASKLAIPVNLNFGTNEANVELFEREENAKEIERLLRSRFYWIELVNSIQRTLDGADGKILILTNPNELMPKGTNEVNQINAEKVAEADAAVWIQSLTMTKPTANSGGEQGGFGGSAGGEGGFGGEPGGGGGMGETISVIYLKLMAKNVLADAPNGEKVRTRETLNREFATMIAKQLRRNELFSDDETLTKVDGQISMKEIDGTHWFEFVIQLSLKDPIVMKDKKVE